MSELSLSGDAPHKLVMIITNAEEIARTVASIIKEKRSPFARLDIRDKLGLSPEKWL